MGCPKFGSGPVVGAGTVDACCRWEKKSGVKLNEPVPSQGRPGNGVRYRRPSRKARPRAAAGVLMSRTEDHSSVE